MKNLNVFFEGELVGIFSQDKDSQKNKGAYFKAC